MLRTFNFCQIVRIIWNVIVKFNISLFVNTNDNQRHFDILKLRHGFSHSNHFQLFNIGSLSRRNSFSKDNNSLRITIILVLEIVNCTSKVFIDKFLYSILSTWIIRLRPISTKVRIYGCSHTIGSWSIRAGLITRHIYTYQHGWLIIKR